MGRADPRPLRVYVRDHAARAGATNRGEGLAGGRPIGAVRSARGRVIAGVLFTCSQSDLSRLGPWSWRQRAWRARSIRHGAPRERHASAPIPLPPSHPRRFNVVYVFHSVGSTILVSLRSHIGRERPRLFVSTNLFVLRYKLTSLSLSLSVLLYPFLQLSRCFLFYANAMTCVLSNKDPHIFPRTIIADIFFVKLHNC